MMVSAAKGAFGRGAVVLAGVCLVAAACLLALHGAVRAQELGAHWNVPGHGFVDDADVLAEELETAIEALETVIAESLRLHQQGLSAEEAVAAADFGDLETWSLRDSQRAMALGRVFMELDKALP